MRRIAVDESPLYLPKIYRKKELRLKWYRMFIILEMSPFLNPLGLNLDLNPRVSIREQLINLYMLLYGDWFSRNSLWLNNRSRICYKICDAVFQTFGRAFEDFRRLFTTLFECLKSSVTCLCYDTGHAVPIRHDVLHFALIVLEPIPRQTLNLDSTLVYI